MKSVPNGAQVKPKRQSADANLLALLTLTATTLLDKPAALPAEGVVMIRLLTRDASCPSSLCLVAGV